MDGQDQPTPTLGALSDATKKKIEAAQPKNAAGEFIDPKTGKVIKEPQFGHRYGRENWRIKDQADKLGLNQKQLDDFVNAHPHYFKMQEKAINEKHIGEMLGPDPQADGKILEDMKRFFGL